MSCDNMDSDISISEPIAQVPSITLRIDNEHITLQTSECDVCKEETFVVTLLGICEDRPQLCCDCLNGLAQVMGTAVSTREF